jgi:DNA-binding response OmpR family regulator
VSEEQRQLLIVDDDPGMRELLSRYLGAQGFAVAAVGDARAMQAHLAAHNVDLLILDLMLPGEDGLSVAHRLRAAGGPPIIIISARGEEVDRIVGLEVGADDYLPKPFNPRELLARIRAVLRRGTHGSTAERGYDVTGQALIQAGPFRLDVAARRAWREDQELALTSGEFALLEIFARRPGRVMSRDVLIDLLKGYERAPFDRSIDVRINRLRQKVEPDPSNPCYLRTIWGEGYVFDPGHRS